MKSIKDYSESTSSYELFEYLYNQVITRKISKFSQLMDHVHDIPVSELTQKIYRKIFNLIKELNWGEFSRLDPKEYPDLWKELVVPQRNLKGTGDLKRNTSISSVYTAILDIHGYSAFCLKHRRNLSMLELLDVCITQDIQSICSQLGTLSWRTEGDTLVLISASARKITEATLNIIEYFSKKRVFKSRKIIASQVLNKIALPEMAVSAGIAGGRAFNPMVITYNGDISGDNVNVAARLQSFAKILDPNHTRVLVSNHVAHQLKKKRPNDETDLSDADYLFLGRFQFKGMDLTVFEILFEESQKIKLQYQKNIVQLHNSLRKGQWREQIFNALISLISRVIETCSRKTINGIKREDLVTKCAYAQEIYNSGKNYKEPVEILEEFCDFLPAIPSSHPVISLYGEKVLLNYRLLSKQFYSEIERNFEKSIDKYLNLSQRDLFIKADKSRKVLEKIMSNGIQGLMNGNQKYTWHRITDENGEALENGIYIGKK